MKLPATIIKWMLATAVIAILFTVVCAKAQTTTQVPNLLTNYPVSGGGLWTDLGNLAGDLGLSSNPTNYAGGIFAGMKTSQNQFSIGAYVVENVNNYVGVIAGVDELFGGGKLNSENIFSGGLTLKAPTHPLRLFTSNPKTWAYKLTVTPYTVVAATLPIGGTGNAGGGLGGLIRGGVNVDLYNWSGWIIALGSDYGNRTGAGAYNGDWIDGTLNLRKGF